MYTHISKGFTMGGEITRRVFRNFIGLPGFIIDCIIAIFYTSTEGRYLDYWEDCHLAFVDNCRGGPFKVVTGFFADIAGLVLGSAIGSIVGGALFFPDAVLRILSYGYNKLVSKFTDIASAIERYPFFSDLNLGSLQSFDEYIRDNWRDYHESFRNFTTNPNYNYFQKAWNLSAATLGVIAATPFYLVSKTIEFFIPPLGNALSNTLWKSAGYIGVGAGLAIATALWPVTHLAERAVTLYKSFRDKIRSISAFVYAKTNVTPTEDDECIPRRCVHSAEFVNRVNEYKHSSTAQILLGQAQAEMDAAAAAPAGNPAPLEELLDDPILQTRLVNPVIDSHGHTFSRESITRWIREQGANPRCPLDNMPINENELIPNRLVENVLRM